jgi:uncharacterized protein (TIGR03083 family)
MDRTEFLDTLKTARAEWDALLAQISPARMTEPGVEGDWTIKDVVAHITWFEREMVGVIRARALVGSDLWDLPQDQRNAAILAQNRLRPLDEVLAEARLVYPQLVEAVQTLDDQDLHDPGRFAGMPADWLPWSVIAGNSFEHYSAHAADVRSRLNTLSPIASL